MNLGQRHSKPTSDNPILPLKNSDIWPPSRLSLTKRYTRVVVVVIGALGLLFFFYGREAGKIEIPSIRSGTVPPLYEKYHEYERHLPQHNLSLPFPEGRDAKFFWAANHVTGSGWGNAMQELIVNAHLARVTKRAFVFDNFTWDQDGPDYSEYNGKLIPSRIPLSAMISGPIIGATSPPGDDVPRSVSREYFKKVCPNPTIIDSAVINEELRTNSNVPASYIFDKWVEKLNSIDDPCVEIQRGSYQLFEIWIFGSRRILSLWPTLSKSPMLLQFSWSPLILNAFTENEHLISSKPSSSRFPYFTETYPTLPPPETHDLTPLLTPPHIDPIRGLLVLHIRRGDFQGHCQHLANWSADWNGLNAFPSLPDKFDRPTDGGWGETSDENMQMYLKKCFPSIEQIVEKIQEVLADQDRLYGKARELKRIYIMTNGAMEWVNELRSALMNIKKWESVVSSRELQLSWEAKYVAQTVDMLIGQRAQVFIGNGFSSLTSNIVMFRMLRELPHDDTRFW
ncbi:hypothetical protein SERLA73DRAFT_187372 [Serpula lacrymans var. lacrymans S7.3]|uniref:Uncharacterized protein n=2 Tax=Serpula lacrymans var. lacrymans TaxID=341189 RepID=F8Q928_SERL3|nr:uncharacterized protein SERLADRAFT_476875 [Serpula lacrymans var. lacrymans S7.9]EGN95083.1 hypothetical protein SERLA73DRAFT_187372 [Serpula lacrymans var. lacrymans S7.3]EGO20572.1 hypothetical protein SERLADRAFT_476875 [Serpula lacrymans var. lacrymans S7.9]